VRGLAEVKHTELSKAYSKYIKNFAFLILDCKILQESPMQQLDRLRASSPSEVIWVYNRLKEQMAIIIKEIYPNILFCCNYRIYKNMVKLLYIDLAKLYKVCYSCVVELTKDLGRLDLNLLMEVREMCKSFIEYSKEIEEQVSSMIAHLKEPLTQTIYLFKVILVK